MIAVPVPDSDTAREWEVVGWPRGEALHFLRQARDEIAANGGPEALPFTVVEIEALHDLIAGLTH